MPQDEAQRGAVDPAREPSYRPETDTDQALDALDDLPDAVLCFDDQDFCTYANHQAARLVRRAREELLGEPLVDVLPQPLGRVAQDHCRRVHQWGQVRCEARTLQGHYEIRLTRQRVGYFVHLRERDGADNAAARQLRLVADHAPVLIAYCDDQGRYKFVNRPYAERFGLEPEALIGKRIPEVVGEAAYASFQRYVQQALAGQDVEFEAEVPYQHGGTQYMRCAYRPERAADGRVVGLVAAISNITDRRRAEQAVQESARRKDEFLASLAHELRNPLAPLANGLQILKLARDDAATVQQAQAMMGRQLAQLVRLVDDLLDVSRISRGTIELRPEALEISQVLDGAVETCQEAIRNAGVQLQVSLPASPLRLRADRARLVQVVCNLLSNAAKFTPRGGQVLLSAERDNGGVLIRVRDTGIGIDPAQLASVFDLFVQAERSLERTQVGLGVGLTIVRRLVELHGGRVEAHSEGRDRGCEVRVWLPAATVPDAAPLPDAAVSAGADAPRRILLVDDNEDAALSLAMALRLMHHEVRVAYDGSEALSVGEAFRPEVVLLDIGMPRLNGYDTARQVRLRSWGRGATLVALTGLGQDGDRAAAVAAGFDHHLVKPADIDVLRGILARTPA